MQITYYSGFSKRINSTKRPTPGTGTTLTNVLLKEGADVIAPVFTINTLDMSINYVEAFGNYYFCETRNLDGHRTELRCSLDHLATFKTQIGSYTGLIERTSASSNVMITDPLNTPTCEVAHAHVSSNFSWSTDSTGCYIVGVAAKGGVKQGTTTFYAMSKQGLADICDKIYDSNLWNQMWNQFNGVQNAIISSFWVPFSLGFVTTYFTGGVAGNFYIGDEVITASDCYNIASRIHTEATVSITATFPFQFGGVQVPNYVYKAPYTTGTLYLPFVGEVELPIEIACDNPKFNIDAQMDIMTGDIIYYVSGEEAGLIGTYTGNFASKIPVSGATYDAIGTVQGAASMIIGGITTLAGNPAGGGAAMLSGMGSTVNSLRLHSQCNGGISSALGGLMYNYAKIDIHTALPAEPDLDSWKAERGLPYNKTATISSLSGYVQCFGASVSIPGDGQEQSTVNGYLNSGFYYE